MVSSGTQYAVAAATSTTPVAADGASRSPKQLLADLHKQQILDAMVRAAAKKDFFEKYHEGPADTNRLLSIDSFGKVRKAAVNISDIPKAPVPLDDNDVLDNTTFQPPGGMGESAAGGARDIQSAAEMNRQAEVIDRLVANLST